MEALLTTIVFYVFAGITLLSGLAVIASRNPVHSVFFLILAFFNSAGLFLLIGAEYIAMTLVIVYVGAVAVLFLFVVMMLNINFAELRQGFMKYLPIGAFIAAVIFAELVLVLQKGLQSPTRKPPLATDNPVAEVATNTHALGSLLYTEYVFAFQVAGIILLVAMIGAIVLTLRSREGVRKQNIARQVARKREDAMRLVDVESGQGAD